MITSLKETLSPQKAKLGLSIGAMAIVQVCFGLYSVKLVSIPLFLTFRRCSILSTIIVQYLAQGIIPDYMLCTCATIIVSGGLVAGWESLGADYFGYLLIWGNNFSQGIQNVYTSKYNAKKQVAAFEINFFFACIGLPLMLSLCVLYGDLEIISDIVLRPKPE